MDPIAAPVTALIPQPVGILRISGSGSWERLRPLFPELPLELEHRRVYVTSPLFEDRPLDEIVLLFFKSPNSFTGEDLIEIHLHGNPHNMRALLALIQRFGIRLARPGEFSMRSYQNKKMSLLKAESLHRMIQAPSYAQFRASHQQYANESTHPLRSFQDGYLDLLATLFTGIDHPDSEDSDSVALARESLLRRLSDLIVVARGLSKAFKKNRRIYQGFTVLLAGHPNSGKSSLFNRVLKDNRAIVSPIPGTTRDLVEGRLSLSCGDITFVDSAGLRSTTETIEQEGIRKTLRTLVHADCILWISSPDQPESTLNQFKTNLRGKVLYIWNKCDISLPSSTPTIYDYVLSARTRKGIRALLKTLESMAQDFYSASIQPPTGLLDSERQHTILSKSVRTLERVSSFLENNQFDLALSALEEGRRVLDDGVGIVPSSDIYDRVFRMFCLGK